MYQSQQRSTDLCIDFYLLPTQYTSCGRNCLRSNSVDLCTGGCDKIVPWVALGYPSPYAVPAATCIFIPYLSVLIFIMHCLSGRCHIRYRVFPIKTPEVYCTVGS
jgi:hypothetical protein